MTVPITRFDLNADGLRERAGKSTDACVTRRLLA